MDVKALPHGYSDAMRRKYQAAVTASQGRPYRIRIGICVVVCLAAVRYIHQTPVQGVLIAAFVFALLWARHEADSLRLATEWSKPIPINRALIEPSKMLILAARHFRQTYPDRTFFLIRHHSHELLLMSMSDEPETRLVMMAAVQDGDLVDVREFLADHRPSWPVRLLAA